MSRANDSTPNARGQQDVIPNSLTESFLNILHRGGQWGYYWTAPGKVTTWFRAGSPAAIPNDPKQNIYFGVHPAKEKRSPKERARIEDIAAVNCLFAEFDIKDFGSREALDAHLDALNPYPSVEIDSGGGSHCYWILDQPFLIETPGDRERAKRLQADWVGWVGGDPGAKDLARVLRVPGTFNQKYDPARLVSFVGSVGIDQLLYSVVDLECYLPAKADENRKTGIDRSQVDTPGYYLRQALLRAGSGRNEAGIWLACQLRDYGLHQSEADPLMREYAARAPGGSHPYTEGEALASLRSAYTRPAREPARLPVEIAGNNGHFKGDLSKAPIMGSGELPDPPGLNDVGNGKRLAGLFSDRLRYVKAWGWLAWDGKRWKRDDTGAVMRYAKATARSIYGEAQNALDDDRAKAIAKWAGSSHSRNRLDAMIYLAQSDYPMPAEPVDFDTSSMTLTVLNGTIDLTTGRLQPHDSGGMTTKLAGVEYDPGADCPTWLSFLKRIFAGNEDLIGFLQRAVGYTLTGSVGEQILLFLYGTGANGKSTFLNTILHILGEYGLQAAPQVLMIGDRHPTEIAALAGARFVSTVEIEEGRQLAEVLVKQLTGGDRLTARYMHRDLFEFEPTFKIWLAANHKPVIRGTDYAIWRRVKLIPFEVTIPKHEQDINLLEKLKAEGAGILAWAVRGCLDWQRAGLRVPAIVDQATEEYRAESDIIGQFIADCCRISDLLSVTAGDLYQAYKDWTDTNGLRAESQIKFSRRLHDRGFTTGNERDGAGRAVLRGIGLIGSLQE